MTRTEEVTECIKSLQNKIYDKSDIILGKGRGDYQKEEFIRDLLELKELVSDTENYILELNSI